MNTDMTLFARYKNMINTMYNEGFRTYTANELNTFVGAYETKTAWKRWNKNPHYTTRTYQTALKQLGCITKVKRGLWKINGPIPEWFGSFHINALSSSHSLHELEKTSTYWKSLKPEHKINPWKRGDGSIITQTNNTQTMNKTTDCIFQTITGTILMEEFPQLTMDTQISVSVDNNNKTHVDICDWHYYLLGKEISIKTAEAICNTRGKNLESVYTAHHNTIIQQTISEAQPISTEGFTKDGARYYSHSEVMQILKDFANGITDQVSSAVEEVLEDINADDVVELEWDSYNKTMNVSLDLSNAVRDITEEIQDAVEEVFNGYDIESVQLS